MAKMTTEEFIKKAREVHGDKYDYSKAEYVNSKEKVTIICPVHGEFLQTPQKHLYGQGCPKCGLKKFENSRIIWTKEKCFEVAQECHSQSELREKYSSAYQAASRKGWLKEYTWFDVLWEPKWDRDACYNEAKKYDSRGSFKKGCPYGYSSARKHGWLDDYVWFNPVRVQVPIGYWTYERCYAEAQKYKTQKEFGEKSNGAYQCASRKGWIKNYTWFEKPFRWSRELCEQESRKYATIYDFYNNNKTAYSAAVRYGWLDSFTWLQRIVRPNGYWTRERCEEEARKYNTKGEFLKGCSAAHSASVRNGWLDDFDWLIDQRIDVIKGKIDSVYVYIFEETRAAYVGRTLIKRQDKRDKEHLFNQESDSVAIYAKSHNIQVPPMIILESNLTLKEGLEREDYWRQWYEKQGYAMLNKGATGIGKGSLGAINNGKWNRNTCYKEAQKYKSRREFEKANASAYDAARRNNWIKDYIWFEILWEPKWDKDTCYQEAKKYKTRGEFQKGSPSAYTIAHRRKWIEQYNWLDSRIKYPKGYWDDYDRCYQEAKKYKSRIEFQNGNKSAYVSARKHGWLDDYVWFKEKAKNKYWNRETCYDEAKKYKSATEFARHAVRAYGLSKANGWDKDYTWFDKPFRWTKELCKTEANKYKTRSQFRNAMPGAYHKSRENGWLDEFFPISLRRKLDYDTCKKLTSRYQNTRDLYKGDKSLYKTLKEKGWLDDFYSSRNK